MAKLQSASIRTALNMELDHNITMLQVAGATHTLIKALHVIDSLVVPKRFILNSAYLRRFEAVDKGFSNHSLRVDGDNPIDEISEWQVVGTAGDRIVNVIAYGVFHTHQNNRSGGYEYLFNGKPFNRPEYGGVTVDDIWQESGLYQQFDKATSHGVVKQSRKGHIIQRYH